jgi:hypothetical protein
VTSVFRRRSQENPAGKLETPIIRPRAGQVVSVIVPCRNEVDFIDTFVHSLMAQRLPGGLDLEILIADGKSDDGTREELDRLARQHPSMRVIDNPKRTAAAGLNAAIRQARGDVLIRMDVHTSCAMDYILECLRALETSGADNVGGPWVAQGSGYVPEAIALAFSSLLVSGGGKAHRADYEGFVDTVYLGCCPRRRSCASSWEGNRRRPTREPAGTHGSESRPLGGWLRHPAGRVLAVAAQLDLLPCLLAVIAAVLAKGAVGLDHAFAGRMRALGSPCHCHLPVGAFCALDRSKTS